MKEASDSMGVLVRRRYPDARASDEGLIDGRVASPDYLLFMFESVSRMTDERKAARWYGWAMVHAHMLGVSHSLHMWMPELQVCQPNFYQGTTAELLRLIKGEGAVVPSGSGVATFALQRKRLAPVSELISVLEYIRWMGPRTHTVACRAALFIGWALAQAELRGLLTNEESRCLIRDDKKNGYE